MVSSFLTIIPYVARDYKKDGESLDNQAIMLYNRNSDKMNRILKFEVI